MRQPPWLRTLVAYGLAQSAFALSAFIKVPLIIGAGGNAAYAAVTLIISAWAITAALADGLGQTSRVMLAERGIGQSERVRRLVGGAASGEALVMTLVAVVGFVVLLAIGHSTELWLLYFGFAIVCLPVSYAKGILEASDRTALSNATLATNVVVSLPLVALAAYFSGGEVWLCAATLGGVAAPFAVFAYLVRTPGLRIFYRPRTTRQTMSTVFSTTVYSFANVMAYAFDPIIIAAFMTSREVSAFGLASRIMTLAMLLPLALGGLISARVNSWRGQTAPGDSYRPVRRLCLQLGAAGAIVSALAVAIGPVIGQWLGRGVIETPFTLYLAFGAYAVVSSATAPIFALFSGPGVAHFRAIVAMVAGIANLGLSALLIYPFGVAGPVVASLICLVAMVVMLLAKTRHGMDAIMMIHN